MDELNKLIHQAEGYIGDPTKGLPEELFLFSTEIVPMINVDLLIRDQEGSILLSWRDDVFEGQGWHVPGGIIRLKETFDERLQRTAVQEIGCEVTHSTEPVEIIQIIKPEKKVRCHFITLVYECMLPEGYQIDNKGRQPYAAGYLQWFQEYPEDMLKVHACYKKYFKE